jgi:hypothetical protein
MRNRSELLRHSHVSRAVPQFEFFVRLDAHRSLPTFRGMVRGKQGLPMMKFDIDAEPLAGVRIIAPNEVLTTRCSSELQIDNWVLELKQELDQAAKKAKTAIGSMRNLSDFPVGPN